MNFSTLIASLVTVAIVLGTSPLKGQRVDTTVQTGPKLRTEGVSRLRVIPGPQYEAGGLHRFFFGGLWRDLWTTPIDVDVLDLNGFAGGLTPLKRGGGFQTKSLRFQAKDGRQFKFRSLDKDPAQVLPPDLRETFVADIVQDFIATSNPVSALVAVPIINAAGVLNTEPILIVLPDDDRLGEFRAEFGGLLGTLEENPIDDSAGDEGFAGSDKVILTLKLFARLEKDNDERVDADSYLTARLVDIYLGDWDRHVDQWKWGRFEEENKKVWRPIPRDRDQAYCRYNGIIPDIIESYIPQIEGANEHYPSIKYLTWSGRHTDWRYLSSIDRHRWDSITEALISHITDSVIDRAVHRMPQPMYEIEGENLRRLMIERRNKLREASRAYFLDRNDVVDVRGSNKAEFADLLRRDDNTLEVTLYDLDRERRPKGTPFFHRAFNDDETSEIRLYMMEGDDSIQIHGDASPSIKLRVIRGADTSTGGYEPLIPDRGFEWIYFPWVNYTTDEGAFLGWSATLNEYGFRAVPYRDQLVFKAGYATGANRFKAEFLGDFPKAIEGARIATQARASGLEVIYFFGRGNETANDSGGMDTKFFKVKQQQVLARATIAVPLVDKIEIYAGAQGKYTHTDQEEVNFVTTTSPYGVADGTVLTGLAGATIDTRNNPSAPSSGFYMNIEGGYHPKISSLREPYTSGHADIRAYIPLPLKKSLLALRVAGEKIEGEHPYYESAFIGGVRSLRGFYSQRFAGDASLYGVAEIRLYLTKLRLIVPVSFGISGFGESGRVFVNSEDSKQWHSGFGGGIWFTVLDPQNTLSISAATSTERLAFYLTAGFSY